MLTRNIVVLKFYEWIRKFVMLLMGLILESKKTNGKSAPSIVFSENKASILQGEDKQGLSINTLTDWTDKFGGTVSNCLLDPLTSLFRVEGIEGCIAYRVSPTII